LERKRGKECDGPGKESGMKFEKRLGGGRSTHVAVEQPREGESSEDSENQAVPLFPGGYYGC